MTSFSDTVSLMVNDRLFACFLCGSTVFQRREIKMQTTGMNLMGMDWANAAADGAVCLGCDYVHQFYGGRHQYVQPTSPG